MYCVDLHTHTTFSDGTLTPTELVNYAVKKNLKAIAVTDHDTFLGVSEAVEQGKKKNIEIINGIEMSTDFKNKEIHIVGLFIDISNKDFNLTLEKLKEKRKLRNEQIIEKLKKLKIDIDYDELQNISSNKIITRAHFAKLLIKKNYVESLSDSFDKYLGEGKPAYVKREVISAKDTISLINNAGGIAILAHPLLYKFNDNDLNEMLDYLKSLGLKGIECLYSNHTEENTQFLINIAKKHNLKISGGSDFHGDNKPNLDLGTGYGNLKIPYEILENLRK